MRQTDFYWITYEGERQIAKWDEENKEWYLIGYEKDEHYFTDDDVIVHSKVRR